MKILCRLSGHNPPESVSEVRGEDYLIGHCPRCGERLELQVRGTAAAWNGYFFKKSVLSSFRDGGPFNP